MSSFQEECGSVYMIVREACQCHVGQKIPHNPFHNSSSSHIGEGWLQTTNNNMKNMCLTIDVNHTYYIYT